MKRRAFVTGASRGIGLSIVESFNRGEFEVIAPTRKELDLSSPDSVQNYLRRNEGLEIDTLVNNAGENKVNMLEKIPLEDWQRILTTNLTSAFLLIQALAPRMAKKNWGRIVNVSSCYSFLGRAGRGAYSASKSGLSGLTRTAAIEFGSSNVLVNAVCPGFVETDMTRQNNNEAQLRTLCQQTVLGRLARPEEIAELVFYLGSEQNSYLTGQSVVIDGGFSCQ